MFETNVVSPSAAIPVVPSQLLDQGWVHLPGVGEEGAQAVIAALDARVLSTTDVVVREGRALVTSDRALDYHTDHHRADVIIWHCRVQTDDGGHSILADALAAYRSLPAETRVALDTIELFEHSIFPGDKNTHPIVEHTASGPRFYCSFWFDPERPSSDAQRDAFSAFEVAIRRHPVAKLRLAPDDLLVIDNRRILHGRTAITGSRDRHLVRHWLSRAAASR